MYFLFQHKFRYIAQILLLVVISIESSAIQTIKINQGHAEAHPIALNQFKAETYIARKFNAEILAVIRNDLVNSGFFKAINPKAFIENTKGTDHTPLFAAWKQINAIALLNGNITERDDGSIDISYILWDVIAEHDIAGDSFVIDKTASVRAIAHQISNQIYERITGDKGYFDTKIAYIAEKRFRKDIIKRLAIMDQDGANHQFLSDGQTLVLTPRFSPDGKKMLYISYINKIPRVYLRDLATNKDIKVGDFPGMTFAPRFSHDGNKAILSIAHRGRTNIVTVDLKSFKVTPITASNSINTSPSYSPDGKKIVFNSDRGGTRQIYIMDSSGANVQRISFGGGSYTAPVWSPRGDYIAFTKAIAGKGFFIGVIRPDGSGERLLANGWLTESPVWSPNGRVVMFTKEEEPRKGRIGKSRLFSVDLTGYNEKEVHTPGDSSDPEWSLPTHEVKFHNLKESQ